LVKQSKEQILVCAPSNVAVDQLAEKIQKTGLKVIRLCAKSREAVSSSVDNLTLHKLIYKLNYESSSEFRKLWELKETQGELNTSDDKKFKNLNKIAERKLLKAADVKN
jgi:regulator of nonsense transcripts 1